MLFAIANLSGRLIVFLLLPVYTAFLTTEEYAVIDLITVTQQLVFPLVTLGMTEAVIRFGMEKDSDKSAVFFVGFWFVTAGNLFLVLAGWALADLWEPQYVLYFLLLSLAVSFYTFLSAFLRTVDRVKMITAASIVNTGIATGFSIWFVAAKRMGIAGYFSAQITGNLAAIGMMLWSVFRARCVGRTNRNQMRRYCGLMLRYAVPMIPNAVFWWINSSIDRYFLTAFGTLASVGMYAAANKIPSILSVVTSIFQQSWSLSLFREGDETVRNRFFREVFAVYNLLHLLMSLVLVLGAQMICRVLLSGEFLSAWTWVLWLILGFYSNSIAGFAGTEFTAAKRTAWIVVTTFVSAGVNVVLNIVLIPAYGGLGAAIATAASCFALCEIRIVLLRRFFGIVLDNRKVCLAHLALAGVVICVAAGGIFWLFAAAGGAVIVWMERENLMSCLWWMRARKG